ncbi:MAG: M15 family metallopeptidase [bacterium]
MMDALVKKSDNQTKQQAQDNFLKELLLSDATDDGQVNGSVINKKNLTSSQDKKDLNNFYKNENNNNLLQILLNYLSSLDKQTADGETEQIDTIDNNLQTDTHMSFEDLMNLLVNLYNSQEIGLNGIENKFITPYFKKRSLQNDKINVQPYNPTASAASNGSIIKFNQSKNLGIPLGGGKLLTVKCKSGAKFNVNEKVAPQFQGFINELEAMGYKIKPGSSGGFNFRKINGSNNYSQHAYGNAIDINTAENAIGKNGDLPPNIGEIAAKYGISWGGNFKNKKDPMHFEVAELRS